MKTGMKLTGVIFLCGALGAALPLTSRAELIEQRLGLGGGAQRQLQESHDPPVGRAMSDSENGGG